MRDKSFTLKNKVHNETGKKNAEWKILIVDDEEAVHSVTKIALKNETFFNCQLSFLSAFNKSDAIKFLNEYQDIAVVLLDVVMDDDSTGLQIVEYIRQELKNTSVRIILRTGQPGQAPIKYVITEYDINDYKEKTELTNQKLYSAIYSAIRSYRDIKSLEKQKEGLREVINATSTILQKKSLELFAKGVLEQFSNLMSLESAVFVSDVNGIIAESQKGGFRVLAETNSWYTKISFEERHDILQKLFNVSQSQTDSYCELGYIYYIGNFNNVETILFIKGYPDLRNSANTQLLSLFCKNISIACENLKLNDSIRSAQKDLVYKLCELAETRSKETGFHVKRVAHYSRLLGEGIGLNAEECEILFLAAPLHDVGKIGISDSILNKPARLTDEEKRAMELHTTIGFEVLNNSEYKIMKAGAIISKEHHENWDGSGYPDGLKGDKIHIYGRIVALADVFDALASKRCYKEPWSYKEIDDYILSQSGIKFDPNLVKLYFSFRNEFFSIFELFSDESEGCSKTG